MDRLDSDLMYEFRLKGYGHIEALKPIADHAVKEIKSTAGWDTDVQVTVEPEAKDKGLFTVSINVFGLGEPVIVKKHGRHVLAVFRKVRKALLRRLHQLSDQQTASRRKVFFKEQFAS